MRRRTGRGHSVVFGVGLVGGGWWFRGQPCDRVAAIELARTRKLRSRERIPFPWDAHIRDAAGNRFRAKFGFQSDDTARSFAYEMARLLFTGIEVRSMTAIRVHSGPEHLRSVGCASPRTERRSGRERSRSFARSKAPARRRLLGSLVAVLIAAPLTACSNDDATGPEEEFPDPGPGPHFSVLPIPLDSIARIHPLGHNNKVLPIGHSYWNTCEGVFYLRGDQCTPGRYPVRSPADGEVFAIDPGLDGGSRSRVRPASTSPSRMSRRRRDCRSGRGCPRATPSRGCSTTTASISPCSTTGASRADSWRRTAFRTCTCTPSTRSNSTPSPCAPSSWPRSTLSRPTLSRLEFDVAGTAQGIWLKEGAPSGDQVFVVGNDEYPMFLGPLAERYDTRIMTVGDQWPGMRDQLSVVDEADPSWNEITPADGVVSITLWRLDQDALPDTDQPHGSILIEMLDNERLRIEWFDTHEPNAAFTAAARIYTR